MLLQRCICMAVVVVTVVGAVMGRQRPHRILLDTDVDTDDFFALLYLLKLDRSQFDLQNTILLQAVTINANAWTNAGHAVNQVYDILYMMGRDDIPVGVGGEGGILEDGAIQPNVGGYLPIIEQGIGTAGYCRYRQAIPVGLGGRLDIDANFGFRKSFLPQGSRRYSPLRQPTAQQVLIDKVSAGPITVFVIGAHTNFAIFLMNNPHLKKNVEHIYVMGGGVRSSNPTGCCPKNANSTCQPRQCGDRGNMYTDYTSNPYAEFNFFGDPFAAYQVIHSGIPVTLVPLDATNTIPISELFFEAFEQNQHTYEAQYCFKSLKMARDTWFDDNFYTSYFMWDSFASGVATSIMSNLHGHPGENEFAEMEYVNITVVTSNKPYGISDGSNGFFDGLKIPKFNLRKDGVHSGHVQTGLRDPFCLIKNGKGRCKDGYTAEASGREAVRVLLATRAKDDPDEKNSLGRAFFRSFLDVLNRPQLTARFNLTKQFPNYKEVFYKPNFEGQKLGKDVIFDMDMSAGDFLALFYLLKVPVEVINLKAILVSPTGWANAATIDVIYDLLHMMGRDDILVGLGDAFAMNQSDLLFSSVGDCKYAKAIPHGSGGFLDSDTLYGLARDLPRSPRRYTSENSIKFGAPRDTDHPELRQPLAIETWDSVSKSLNPGSKITILTNGPLTNIAKIILSDDKVRSLVKDVFIVGGHINDDKSEKGNVMNVPSNKYAEFNIFLDPLAAKTVFDSDLSVTLIPIGIQRKVSEFPKILDSLHLKRTPEALFARRLISRLHNLQQRHHRYQHMDTFLGEILGAVILAGDQSVLNATFQGKPVEVHATGLESEDGELVINKKHGKSVKILESLNSVEYYDLFANQLGNEKQSAVIGSFEEQRRRGVFIAMLLVVGARLYSVEGRQLPHRILLDTDVDVDDVYALLYLLKLNRSEFDLQGVTINTNSWTNAGHAVNHVYDILHMMGRDDIAVGVGGEGGILDDGKIMPDVGGYLPIIEQVFDYLYFSAYQRTGTVGYCRYRQAIPVGLRGRLDIDTNYGVRKSFLPQGSRTYSPVQQATAQQVMIDKISAGPTTVFLIGAHTNFAIFLMHNAHLRKHVEHIYVMGGGVRSKNPTGCCPKNASSSCQPGLCGDPGNLFMDYTSNPYAEYNIFLDPFAAYQVIHSGIPVTLVPLDATNTIPVTEKFFEAFEQNQHTYEAQYCFKSLKMVRDTYVNDQFYTSRFMWDFFACGVATSIMRNMHKYGGENEFAEVEYMNITVITSNKPYGISDGSNPFFDGLSVPKFMLKKDGVHSGHVQNRLRDPFCLVKNGKGRCKDGYTAEVNGPEAVHVLVATRAKPDSDNSSSLEREFSKHFLEVINRPQQTGRFSFTSQCPDYKEVLLKPDFGGKKLGNSVVFDMDMSAGDFLALFYLLKLPVSVINLKAILVSSAGWANAATIDVVYDLLHMMGRDDIPVGLGDVFAISQSDSLNSNVGDCKYMRAIPHGSGGLLDSDTLYGSARDFPRSPRRYTAENSVKYGAPRDTDHPELRQPLALEIWESVSKSLDPGSKVTVLTNGPLTNLAKIINSDKSVSSLIRDVIIVGGHVNYDHTEKGNVINVPSNEYSELNMFLDPLAAKIVFDSKLNITLIPLGVQRKVSEFSKMIERLNLAKETPEANFALRLLSRLHDLQQTHHSYQHMDIFLGEILGAVIFAGDHSLLNSTFQVKPVKVYATGVESEDGCMIIDKEHGKLVKILEDVDPFAYYDLFANQLGNEKQSAVVRSFDEQCPKWS
ncbi:hypothetical protein RJ640_014948 [Escallonia rubra]|uniref:Inosine/uridine-preferring nucleoside hydrolase domain-containing protein n=1 Tax=Escallonia rubra TaxID=112253 RepID=A0AA88UUH3_9ASTE|nr:hypothetical protein RJ640_014948 [Escallonia rubra]